MRHSLMRTEYFLQLFRCLVIGLLFIPASLLAQKQQAELPAKCTKLKSGDIASISKLLSEGISVNAVDEDGYSLLMLAASRGDLKQMKYLIEMGADVNQRNKKDFLNMYSAPLDYAIARHEREAVDYLLELNVDANVKDPAGMTSVYRCALRGNSEMLRYLVDKGVSLSDEDRINVMVCAASTGSPEASKIICYMLEDIYVEQKDIEKSKLLFPNESSKVCSKILALQAYAYDGKAKEVQRRRLQSRQQDSLRHLIETGQKDTVRYRYIEVSTGGIGSESSSKVIEAVPRVDGYYNRLGYKSAGVVLLLLVIAILLAYCFARLAAGHIYKKKFLPVPTYYLLHIAVGVAVIYPMLSSIYINLDDIMIRKYGKEYTATLFNEVVRSQYKHRGEWHFSEFDKYSFLFRDKDSVMIAVEQDRAKFDTDYQESGKSDITIKVRYDEASRKLSVDEEKYYMQNLWGIAEGCFFFGVIYWASRGGFNYFLQKIIRKLKKRPQTDTCEIPAGTIIDLSYCLISTFWTFTSKKYYSMDEFIRDVKLSEQQHNQDVNECLQPDKVIIERPDVVFVVFDSDIIGNNDLCIKIISDNGRNITAGELLFKLHNQMIPYLGRLVSCTINQINILSNPYLVEDELIEGIIMFE